MTNLAAGRKTVGVIDAEGEGVSVGHREGDALTLGDREGVSVGHKEGDALGVAEGEDVSVGHKEGDTLMLGESETDGDVEG